MLYWFSPSVPYYIDSESLAYCIYNQFFNEAPAKSGTMRDGIQYEVIGSQIYFWDDVIYAHYQDTVTSYEGWWSHTLPHLFDYWLRIFESNAKEDANA